MSAAAAILRRIEGSAGVAGGLNQGSDIAEAIGPLLQFGFLFIRDAVSQLRNVVHSNHAVIADIAIDGHGPGHVYVSSIGRKFCYEVPTMSLDVAKVDAEYFIAFAEPANDIVDLPAGILQH